MRDISDNSDIQLIIDTFYSKVKVDDVIGYIFNDIAKVDWDEHLPIMYNFWESTVFGTGTYSRNAMTPHFKLNEKVKLEPHHFVRWVELFTATVDELFTGEHAGNMKQRAINIASVMEHKLNDTNRLRII